MDVQFICEILGTVAFSISGAMIAIKHGMDILGVTVLGVATALGGGLLRDIILNITPLGMFANTVSLCVAVATSLYVFFTAKYQQRIFTLLSEQSFNHVLNIIDAIGLGMFTVVGVNTALAAHHGQYAAFVIFLGVLTGVGGGVIRDILAGVVPKIFRKHIYASASLLGASFYYYAQLYHPCAYSIFICSGLVIAIRVAADRWAWNLPKVN